MTNVTRLADVRKDTRIVYGASCTWWDGIHAAGHAPAGPSGHRLPCCPHCGSMLFEMDSDEPWFAGARRYEADGHPGYVAMIEWARGRCFPNLAALEQAYADATTGDAA